MLPTVFGRATALMFKHITVIRLAIKWSLNRVVRLGSAHQ